MSDDDRFNTRWFPSKIFDTKDSRDLGYLNDETILRCINTLAAEVERLTARVQQLERKDLAIDAPPQEQGPKR